MAGTTQLLNQFLSSKAVKIGEIVGLKSLGSNLDQVAHFVADIAERRPLPASGVQIAAGINVQILDFSGAKGPSGNFKPGDTISMTYRLVKDDGTTWHLAEMDSARAAVSGPTFNYQRVIAQVRECLNQRR